MGSHVAHLALHMRGTRFRTSILRTDVAGKRRQVHLREVRPELDEGCGGLDRAMRRSDEPCATIGRN